MNEKWCGQIKEDELSAQMDRLNITTANPIESSPRTPLAVISGPLRAFSCKM